ncbi:hypothetical protein vseg_018361 [Gypsophila vaccaria]
MFSTFFSNASHHKHPSTTFSIPNRRNIHLKRRRRRLPILHLGGKKPPQSSFFVPRLFRRARRLKWLGLKYYIAIFKRLKQYYKSLIRDMIEASAYQPRMFTEASLIVPNLGGSSAINNYSVLNYHVAL